MKCCYGLVNTNIQDIYHLLRGKVQVASNDAPEELSVDMPVIVLGIDNLRRLKDKLEDHMVLVLDAKVKFSGLTVKIIDRQPLTYRHLASLLRLRTPRIELVKKRRDPVKKILERNSSVLASFLHAKYARGVDARAAFIAQFKRAIETGETENADLKRLLQTEKGQNFCKAVREMQKGKNIEAIASKYSLAPFDLHYIKKLFSG